MKIQLASIRGNSHNLTTYNYEKRKSIQPRCRLAYANLWYKNMIRIAYIPNNSGVGSNVIGCGRNMCNRKFLKIFDANPLIVTNFNMIYADFMWHIRAFPLCYISIWISTVTYGFLNENFIFILSLKILNVPDDNFPSTRKKKFPI